MERRLSSHIYRDLVFIACCTASGRYMEFAAHEAGIMPSAHLEDMVQNEALLWGESVASTYFIAADETMDLHWTNLIWPMLSRHKIDMSETMELACGHGRNSRKLLAAGAGALTLVDVNIDNVNYCLEHIAPLGNISVVRNNGIDLDVFSNAKFTFLYTFDSMVHFDLELVISYVREFSRVLKPGGAAFIHHSNYTDSPGADFRRNPHWRNFNSALIMQHIAIRSGLEVIEQQIVRWGECDNLDCFSLLQRPS